MISILPRSRVRALLTGAGVLIILFLAFLLWQRSVNVGGTDWKPLSKLPFEFRFQSLNHPALEGLREREKLDVVVAGGADRFGKVVRLCHWTRMQWEPGDPKPYPPWNALAILDLIRAKKTGGFCAQYAQVFAQACLSFGWQPRYIEIGPRDHPTAHFTTEVWIDPLGKWVILDPFYDIWFDREGVPLSSLEVHRALVGGTSERVIIRRGPDGQTVQDPQRQELLSAFYYIRFLRKMDHLSRPEAPFEWKDKVDWSDAETVLWHNSGLTHPTVRKGATAPLLVVEPELFDFPINRVMVEILADRFRSRASLHLSHFMPDFDHYQVRVGVAPSRRLDGDRLEVAMETRPLRIEIIPVNIRGAEGIPAHIVLDY